MKTGRGWNDTSTSQEMPTIASNSQKLGKEAWNRLSFRASQKEPIRLMLRSLTSDLQNYELGRVSLGSGSGQEASEESLTMHQNYPCLPRNAIQLLQNKLEINSCPVCADTCKSDANGHVAQ